MLLTGTFTRSLDEKQRFNVPKPVREVLQKSPTHSDSPPVTLYMAPGTDGSLALYPEEAFSRLAERLSQNSPTGQDVRAFSRLFYAQAQRVELDSQGRVRVPAELAALGGLNKEVVLLGAGDRLEIWDRTRWHAYLGQKQPRYDEIAERAFGSLDGLPPAFSEASRDEHDPLSPSAPRSSHSQASEDSHPAKPSPPAKPR